MQLKKKKEEEEEEEAEEKKKKKKWRKKKTPVSVNDREKSVKKKINENKKK